MHRLLDPEIQEKAQKYETEKRLLGFAATLISILYLGIFYFTGFNSWLLDGINHYSNMVKVIFYLSAFILGISLSALLVFYISGFWHEHKWGFSTQTQGLWIKDQIKSTALSLVLGVPVLMLLVFIIDRSPDNWWLVASLAAAALSIVFSILLPVIILPLFNRYTPVEDRILVERLKTILSKTGLKASGFYRQDMSIRTTKENAFLAGLGKTRRVVLADTLMDNMTIEEIESVIAHEVGHYHNRHLWKNILLSALERLFLFRIIDILIRLFFPLFPFTIEYTLLILPVFMLCMTLISFFINPLSLGISRTFERQADRFALEQTDNREGFISAMAGLANRNLSNAYPKWWIKLLYYSHPPIGERLAQAEEY